MNSLDWMRATVGEDSRNAVAVNAEITQSTLNRQIDRGELSPESVVAIARSYSVPVLPGLVACGLITEQEAALKERQGLEEVLTAASDADLIRAILRRIEDGAGLHSMLTQPLDASHPLLAGDADDGFDYDALSDPGE